MDLKKCILIVLFTMSVCIFQLHVANAEWNVVLYPCDGGVDQCDNCIENCDKLCKGGWKTGCTGAKAGCRLNCGVACGEWFKMPNKQQVLQANPVDKAKSC